MFKQFNLFFNNVSLFQLSNVLIFSQVVMCVIFSITSNLLSFMASFELTLIPLACIFIFNKVSSRANKALKYLFLFTFVSGLITMLSVTSFTQQVSTWDLKTLVLIDTNMVPFWSLIGIFIVFLVKFPVWPVYTWLPFAHVQAPTYGSILLAGSLLKTAVYGVVRVLFNIQNIIFFTNLGILTCFTAFISIIQSGLSALVETNQKKIIAYSSINHMAFGLLSLVIILNSINYFSFIKVYLLISNPFSFLVEEVIQLVPYYGALYFSFSHAVIASALFILTGFIYKLRLRNNTTKFSLLNTRLVNIGLLFSLGFYFVLGNISFPGTPGFTAEVYLLHSLLDFIQQNSFSTTSFVFVFVISLVLGLIFFASILLFIELIYPLSTNVMSVVTSNRSFTTSRIELITSLLLSLLILGLLMTISSLMGLLILTILFI